MFWFKQIQFTMQNLLTFDSKILKKEMRLRILNVYHPIWFQKEAKANLQLLYFIGLFANFNHNILFMLGFTAANSCPVVEKKSSRKTKQFIQIPTI